MIARNILFGNLVQNTKELGLTIPWKRVNTQKDPLLYAKAEVGRFIYIADVSYKDEVAYYGFSVSTKPQKTQVMPGEFESVENFFEGGFNESQKEGLKFFKRLRKLLEEYKI